MGAVARDWKGRVLVSVSRQIDTCKSAEEAEAMAVSIGMSALSKLYRGEIVVELDCAVVVGDLTSSKTVASEWYPLIHDIKLLQHDFKSVNFVAIRRGGNGLAHGLAALAKTKGNQDKIDDIPDEVRELWLSECNYNSE